MATNTINRNRTPVNLDIEELKRLYCEERKSTTDIAKMFGCGEVTVWRRLKKSGIEMSTSERLKGRKKTEDHKRKLSLARSGTKSSDTTKEKIRVGMLKAVERGHNGCFPKGHKPNITQERNAKISKAKNGVRNWKISGENNTRWKGGSHQASEGQRTCEQSWRFVKRAVLERDNYRCQKCGATDGSLDVHHKTPWRFTQDDSMENLVVLCRSCHRKEDARISGNERNLTGTI